jgi:hypothetical protein
VFGCYVLWRCYCDGFDLILLHFMLLVCVCCCSVFYLIYTYRCRLSRDFSPRPPRAHRELTPYARQRILADLYPTYVSMPNLAQTCQRPVFGDYRRFSIFGAVCWRVGVGAHLVRCYALLCIAAHLDRGFGMPNNIHTRGVYIWTLTVCIVGVYIHRIIIRH